MITLDGITGLGTGWWFEFFDTNPEQASMLQAALQERITAFDHQYSRFRADSLVGQLNNERSYRNPPAELVAMLTYGQALYQTTAGHFNLLTAGIQEAHGYDAHHSFACTDTPAAPDPQTALKVSAEIIELRAGAVDLGGFGKGWLIDSLAAFIRDELNLQYFLINGGGDIFVTSDHGSPVSVALAHPSNQHLMLGEVTLHNQALGVSNTYARRWHDRHTGRPTSHIVDTRQPDELIDAAAFVIASKAVEADAWATLGCIEPQLLQNQVDIEYLALRDLRPVASTARFSELLTASQR